MMTPTLSVRLMISPHEANKMVWTFIQHGDHSHREEFASIPKGPIERWFAENNEPLRDVIAKCRTFRNAVPFVENVIGSTWLSSGSGDGQFTTSLFKAGKSEPEIEITSDGAISVDYQAKFESAVRSRDIAIRSVSLDDFHTALIKGISSIESYISHRAEIWDRVGYGDSRLHDSKAAKVAFEDKVKVWIPTMADGEKVDLGGKMWRDFRYLQQVRDGTVHPKKYASGGSFAELANMINLFKSGIATFLFDLHLIFHEPVPRSIIRAMYFPEVYVPGPKH